MSDARGLPLALGLALLASAAHAADVTPADPVQKGFIVTLGASLAYGPSFPGAKKWAFSGLPSIDFRAAGEPRPFSGPQDGLDYALFETPRFAFGPVAALGPGRGRSDMTRRMRGIDTTPTVIQAGVFADYWVLPEILRTRAEVRQELHADGGVVADLSADYVARFGAFTVSGGPRLSAASGDAANRVFGVSYSDAIQNGLVSAYNPSAGVQSVGVGLAVDYAVSPTTTVRLYHQYDRLVGDAANSPIVKRFGTPDQHTFGVGFQHDFSFGN